MRRVLDGALDAVVAFDRSGSIVGWNRAAEALLGWSKSEMLGRPVADTIVTPEDQPRLACALQRVVDDLPRSLTERTVLDRRGRRIPVEVSFSATKLDGCIVYSAFLRDIRERKRAERLRDTEHLVSQIIVRAQSARDLATEAVPILGEGFDWPVAEAFIHTDAGLLCVARWTRDSGNQPVPPDVIVGRGEGLAGLAWERGTVVHGEPDGGVAVPVLADDNLYGVLVLHDEPARRPGDDELAALSSIARHFGQFGERLRAERRLESETIALAAVARATRRLSAATTTDDARQALCDAAREVARATVAFLAEPDDDSDELVVTAMAGAVPTNAPGPARLGEGTAVHRAHHTGVPFFSPDTSSDPRAASATASAAGIKGGLVQPIRGGDEPLGVLAVAWSRRVEVASDHVRTLMAILADKGAIALQRAQTFTGLVAAARTDALTGVANLRAWEETLGRETARAARSGTPLSVAVLDFDRLKTINDEGGHQAGDRALRAAVSAWQTALRQTDVLARPGGDEFAAVLPDCALSDARALGERLRRATPHGHTCSVGVAQWRADEAPEELMERADRALYAAKHGGRNRTIAAR